METAGRQIDDEELREAMRDHGLGTPATRADFIEKLKRREYIRVEGKSLSPTPLGETLIDILPIEELKSPELTGQWEKRIHDVQRGEYDPEAFRAEIVGLTSRLVEALRQQRSEMGRVQSSAPELLARRQREREARQRERGQPGATSPARSLRDSRANASEQGPAKARAKAKKPDKKGREARGPAKAEKAKKAPSGSLGSCPRCSRGEIIRGRVDFGCNRWREGCRFILASQGPLGKKLTETQVKALLARGQTRPLNFEDRGRTFKGRLLLDGEAVRLERIP
jgi:DNA topoisomerase-3